MEKMKITHISGSGKVGGIETHVMALSMAQRKLGHDVSIIIAQSAGPVSEMLAAEGFDVRYANGTSGHDVMSMLRIRRIIRQINPDIVHLHGFSILSFISLAGIPFVRVCTIHVLGRIRKSGLVRRFLSFVNNRIVRLYDGFIAVSADVRDRFLSDGCFTRTPWCVIFNGIDESKFFPDDSLVLPTSADGQPIELLVVCRMEADKHPDDAIRVTDILRKKYGMNVRLTLCGDGGILPACKKLTDELGISDFVTIAGRRNDVNEFMRKSHGLLFLSDYETFGLTPIEAVASGCPVFCYRVSGGLHEWLKAEGCGGVISAKRTPESLAEVIATTLSNHELWQKLRNDAIACSSSFSSLEMAKKTLNYYRSLRG